MIQSLYLHVPFCKTICGYCDFCHFIYREDNVTKWLDALSYEINEKHISKQLKTLYIGGGTPSALSSDELNRLFDLLIPYTRTIEEFTVEINPETITEDKVITMVQAGVNRVSIGVQSSDAELLKLMNRQHDFNDVKQCVALFQKHGITNISIDLMYGLPHQTIQMLEKSLADFIQLNVPHISIYALTIEKNTPFYKKGYQPMESGLEADMYDLIIELLSKHGYQQYEVSSFCQKGYESKHNLAYWHYDDFYGISMGASGKENHVRYTNTRSFKKYLSHDIVQEVIELSKDDEMFEAIMMGFRIKSGFNYEKFNQKFQIDFLQHYKDAIQALLQKKWIKISPPYIVCSEIGYHLLHNVLEYFI